MNSARVLKVSLVFPQVLAEYKQKSEFNELLGRYEEKPICEGRTLELFLTYPMHQVVFHLPRLRDHSPGHVLSTTSTYMSGILPLNPEYVWPTLS